jgi:hypothetical protein
MRERRREGNVCQCDEDRVPMNARAIAQTAGELYILGMHLRHPKRALRAYRMKVRLFL